VRRKTRQQSAFTNPVLIGAVTVLAILVAVFLAYNSNAGLPFVPTRQLKVDLTDGSNLVVNNDVREGGYLIGRISDVKPEPLSNGAVGAQLTLQLNESAGPVPVDSRAAVLSKSVLGLKYLDLIKGTSPHTFPDGGTMQVSQTSVPVQVDQVFDMFNQPTRTAIQQDLQGFGDTFGGRGADFNDTLASLPQLLLYLRPVAQYLSSPPTQLTRFFTTLDTFMRTVAPVANVNAQLFTDMATTFAAFSRYPQQYEATIAKSPSTLSVSTTSLRIQQPFLTDFATLGRALQPASSELRAALPDINPALEIGARTLKRTPVLNTKLQQVMVALRQLARAPGTNLALNALTATVGTLNPMVRYLGPYQTVCNYWNYWWTFLSEHISEATSFGFAQRALLNQTNPIQPNNVATQGATAPVNGGIPDTPLGGNEFLHAQPYGAAIDNQGNADCETGQRGYPQKLNYFDPQGRLFAVDPHTPGDQGPTFAGRPHVPPGETFSRNPQTGPQLLPNPTNP
jgi:virulence factor Mce-like protein